MGFFEDIRSVIRKSSAMERANVFHDVSHVVHTTPPSNMSVQTEGIDTAKIMLYIAAVTALVLAVVLVIVVVLYRRRRKNRRNKISSKYDHFTTSLHRITPFTVISTRRQLSDPTSGSTYGSVDETISGKSTKSSDLELSQYKESKARQNKANLTKYATFETSSAGSAPPTATKGMKRSKSMIMRTSSEESEHTVSVSFTLKYVQKLRQLHLKLLQVSDLSVKHYGSDVYAIVYLFPRNTDGVHSRSVRGGKNVIFNEAFLFDDMTLSEVEKSTLRLSIFYKRKNLSGKDGFVGETFMECGDVDWTSEQPVPFNFDLEKNKFRTGTREKYLMGELGSLFVCLEYQSTANRMKVMVRKASDLPKSDKLIGRPVHYVTVTLLKNNEIVKVQETKSQSGYFPIWNQPFLFDLSGCDVNGVTFDFVIMRSKLHTKDTVVGHVTVGSTGCRSGRLHWKEILSPRPIENARWHSILPVLGTKIG